MVVLLRSLHAALVLTTLVLLILLSSCSSDNVISTTDTASSSAPVDAIITSSIKTLHKTSSASSTSTNVELNTKTINFKKYNPELLVSTRPPTFKPTSKPTFKPTTSSPSPEPTSMPSTPAPTETPTLNPTFNPTKPTSTSYTPISGGKIAGIVMFTVTFAGAIVLAYAHDYFKSNETNVVEGEDEDEKKSTVDPFDMDDDLSVAGTEAAGGHVPSRDENQDISVDADDDDGGANASPSYRSGFAATKNPLRR